MYCQNPESDEPIFLLDKQIGKNDEKPDEPYIDGDDFARELMQMDSRGKKRIVVRINSEGGNVKQGMSIYGAILNTKTNVDTFCVGVAYSMAAIIMQAGRKRTMMDYAQLMFHEAYELNKKKGKPDESTELINQSLATMISSRSWKDEKAVREMMEKTSFINAKNALDSDLCDEIIQSDELNKPRMTADTKVNWKLSMDYANKFLSIKKEHMTKEAKLALGLKEDATDEQAIEAINKLSAFKKKAEEDAKKQTLEKDDDDGDDDDDDDEDKKKAKKKAKKETPEKDNYDDKLAAMELTLKAIQDKEVSATLSAKKESAKAKILGIVAQRGLKFEQKQIDNYTLLAGTEETTLNAVVATLESMTVVKQSAKLPVKSLNKKIEDESGFPMIPDGETEENSPTGTGAGDTTDFINHVNSFQIHKLNKK